MLSLSLPILHSCCTIQIYKMVGGAKRWPHSIVWEVCANTLVSDVCFLVLNQERWILKRQGEYVGRMIKVNGKAINVMMAREILGLPRTPGNRGDKADHKNHDTFDNTLDNLRVATPAQSTMNQGKRTGALCRFKGVWKNKKAFASTLHHNGEWVYLGSFKTEIEAALSYFYAGRSVYGEFFHGNEIPVDEMPSEERQEEIRQFVLKKLEAAGFQVGV